MNPTYLILPIILVVVTCAAVAAGAIFAANVYRRREAEATALRVAARQAEHRAVSEAEALELATAYHRAWIDPATGEPHRNDHICNQQCRDLKAAARNLRAQAASSRCDARTGQQPVAPDSGAGDLVNLLLMQQALNSIDNDHHGGYSEERPEERYESQDQAHEPAEAPSEIETASYSAPEPAYTAPEPISYSAPDPAPSYDAPSFNSGSFGGGDTGSF
ncbi:hypothetical protein [Arthrobacter sp. NicSoilB8]|uniref:hypothetical protein n=1 Tax=Arthrobacter sp. NicSoilB8 TaxID=2830998 RepID=UPI001CC3F9AD|nr:hypothetical protein [Arthrobacter sp. NicSoilB8]BCW71877.1 hypothetical protein NicSoilB8_29210 [Arthrobacter sp. NicSoilB8]